MIKVAEDSRSQHAVDQLNTQPAVTHNDDGTVTIHLHNGHNVTITEQDYGGSNSATGQCSFGDECENGSVTTPDDGGDSGIIHGESTDFSQHCTDPSLPWPAINHVVHALSSFHVRSGPASNLCF